MHLVVRRDKCQEINKAKHYNFLDSNSSQFIGCCLEFSRGMLKVYYFD